MEQLARSGNIIKLGECRAFLGQAHGLAAFQFFIECAALPTIYGMMEVLYQLLLYWVPPPPPPPVWYVI